MHWLLFFICISLFLSWARQYEGCNLAEFVAFDSFVLQVIQALSRGQIDLRSLDVRFLDLNTHFSPVLQSSNKLVTMIEAGRLQGLSALGSLTALRSQIMLAQAALKRRRQLLNLLLLRILLALGLAFGARFLFMPVVDMSPGISGASTTHQIDYLAAGVALALLIGMVGLVLRALPPSWLWQSGMTDQAAIWLQSHLSGKAMAGLVGADEILALEHAEIAEGVSLLAERRRRLVDSGTTLTDAMNAQLQAIEDLLPLAELTGIGGSVSLILLAPMLAMLS